MKLSIKKIIVTSGLFCIPHFAFANESQVVLTHLNGSIYVVEDKEYVQENSVVYIGEKSITIIGATWTPATAEKLANEIKKNIK